MPAFLSDQDIASLLAERKPLERDLRACAQVRPKRGHKECELSLTGDAGSDFQVVFRQSEFNPLDFSVILCYCVPGSSLVVRLRRYNGKSHEHTNKIEGDTFYDFHVHTATERYQQTGLREDSFAQPTDRYCDFNGAVQCMMNDCGFDAPPDLQGVLFQEIQ